MKSPLSIFSWKKSGLLLGLGCLGISRTGCSIVAIEAARSCCFQFGLATFWLCGVLGETVPREGARSARVRRASDQLKRSPVGRRDWLDKSLWEEIPFVFAAIAEGGL